jgi:hypothetical protein
MRKRKIGNITYFRYGTLELALGYGNSVPSLLSLSRFAAFQL